MESQDQVIRSEVEQMVKANKKVTNKEIAAKLKAKGIKSKRGTPLKPGSVPYYRTKRTKLAKITRRQPRAGSGVNVAAAITSLGALLSDSERVEVGVKLLTGTRA